MERIVSNKMNLEEMEVPNAFVTKIRYSTDPDYYATVNGVQVDSVLTSTEDSTGKDPKSDDSIW